MLAVQRSAVRWQHSDTGSKSSLSQRDRWQPPSTPSHGSPEQVLPAMKLPPGTFWTHGRAAASPVSRQAPLPSVHKNSQQADPDAPAKLQSAQKGSPSHSSPSSTTPLP